MTSVSIRQGSRENKFIQEPEPQLKPLPRRGAGSRMLPTQSSCWGAGAIHAENVSVRITRGTAIPGGRRLGSARLLRPDLPGRERRGGRDGGQRAAGLSGGAPHKCAPPPLALPSKRSPLLLRAPRPDPPNAPDTSDLSLARGSAAACLSNRESTVRQNA